MASNKIVHPPKQSLISKSVLLGALLNPIIITLTVIIIPQLLTNLFQPNSPTSVCGPSAGLAIIYCLILVFPSLLISIAAAIILTGLLFKYITITNPRWVAFVNFILAWAAFLLVAIIAKSPGPLNETTGTVGMLIAGIPVFYIAYYMVNRFTFKMWLIILGVIMLLGVIYDFTKYQ